MTVDPKVYADSKESAKILGLDYKAFTNLRDRKSRKTGKNLKKEVNEVLGAINVSGKWYYRRDLLDKFKKFAGDKTVDAAILKSFISDTTVTATNPADNNVGDLSKTSTGDEETSKADLEVEEKTDESSGNEPTNPPDETVENVGDDNKGDTEPVKDFSPAAQVKDLIPNSDEGENKPVEIKVDNEFQALIPPLSNEEFVQLEENILAYGIQDPLKVWNDTIIDGHNRYEIATKHNLPFKVTEMNFDSRDDAIIWIIKNQFGRRNLSTYDRVVLALRLKPFFAAKAKENMLATQNNDAAKNLREQRESASKNSCQLVTPAESAPPKTARENKTNYQVAKAAGVSEDTIRKVEKIEAQATPEIKQALKSGDMSINTAYKESQKKSSDDSVDKKPKVESDRKKAQKTAEKFYTDSEAFLDFLIKAKLPSHLVEKFKDINFELKKFVDSVNKTFPDKSN